MKKTYLSIFLCMLFLFSVSSGALKTSVEEFAPNIVNTSNNGNDADLPLWIIGDNWVYDIQIVGSQGANIDFNLDINNLKFEVTSQDEDTYQIVMDVPKGDISGSGTVDFDLLRLSGRLINTKLDGNLLIKKSNLEIISCEGTIDGFIDKFVDIPFAIDFSLGFYDADLFLKNYSGLNFPLNVDDLWIKPFSNIIVTLQVSLIDDPSYMYMYMDEHYLTCEEWDIVDIDQKEHDSLKITGDICEDNQIFYSPAVGNIISMHFEDINMGYKNKIELLDMVLVSTSYEPISAAPAKPQTPTGPVDMLAGDIASYETSATDPDGDKLRYIFDWGDGTSTVTDFISSGQSIQVEHQWMKGGSFDVKVRARDKYSKESSWSDPIEVVVVNNAPEKPARPTGPIKANYKKAQTYSTSSTDADGHKIRYIFDWGDGRSTTSDLFDSGEMVSISHKYSSQGTYEIKVMAEDEYGGESDWSDPLAIQMPKNKNYMPKLYNLINRIFGLLQNLENLIRI